MEQINWPASLAIAVVVASAASALLVWCCCRVGDMADRKRDARRRVYWLEGEDDRPSD